MAATVERCRKGQDRCGGSEFGDREVRVLYQVARRTYYPPHRRYLNQLDITWWNTSHSHRAQRSKGARVNLVTDLFSFLVADVELWFASVCIDPASPTKCRSAALRPLSPEATKFH